MTLPPPRKTFLRSTACFPFEIKQITQNETLRLHTHAVTKHVLNTQQSFKRCFDLTIVDGILKKEVSRIIYAYPKYQVKWPCYG